LEKNEKGDYSRNVVKIDECTVYDNSTVGIPKTVRDHLKVEHKDKVVWWIINGQVTLRKKLEHPSHKKGDY